MKKVEIVDAIVKETTLSRSQAIEAVECVFDTMGQSLCRGESIFIRGFATVKAYTKKAKKAYHFGKGKTIDLPPHNTARLVLSQPLKEAMNK